MNSSPTSASAQPDSSIAAELHQVSRLYGKFAALRKVSARFHAGRCHILVGENGAGKSTLLRTVAGLLSPSMGRVSIFGQTPHEARARIGYMSHATMLYDELSGMENLEYFAALMPGSIGLSPADSMRAVGLDPTLPRMVGQYSQGMRQRVALARVLLAKPDLLLLDEPFSNMDAHSAGQMVDLLGSMRGSAIGVKTIILTTHQPSLAEPIADAWLTMRAGEIVSQEKPAQ
jgi:ABC-type multidrug transport system ATPase subunit